MECVEPCWYSKLRAPVFPCLAFHLCELHMLRRPHISLHCFNPSLFDVISEWGLHCLAAPPSTQQPSLLGPRRGRGSRSNKGTCQLPARVIKACLSHSQDSQPWYLGACQGCPTELSGPTLKLPGVSWHRDDPRTMAGSAASQSTQTQDVVSGGRRLLRYKPVSFTVCICPSLDAPVPSSGRTVSSGT